MVFYKKEVEKMQFEHAQPFVRQALVGNLNQGHTQDVHVKIKTVDCRLFYILEGNGTMTIESKQYLLAPGTALLFKAGTEYIWEIDNVKYYAINFDYSHAFSHIRQSFHPIHSTAFSEENIIEKAQFEDATALNAPIVIRHAPALERVIEQITTEYSLGGEYSDVLLSVLLKSAIISMLRMQGSEEHPKRNAAALLVRSIIEYINMHYESPISNEDIAQFFHFNSAYLNRIFKVHTGNTLHEFLLSRRITAAMEMLRSQNNPVGEVAAKCGFQSLHHFVKTFKKRINMTPSEYRNFHI